MMPGPADPWEDPSAKRWVKSVLEDMVPPMQDSVMVMTLVPKAEKSEGDVKLWVETGAAIYMNKPLIAIVMGDDPVPPKLEKIADEIVRLAEGVTPDASEELAAAIDRVVGK